LIQIDDNGRGFSQDSIDSYGNGLKNMKKRMDDIGGRLTLTSSPPEGTRIKLVIPLPV